MDSSPSLPRLQDQLHVGNAVCSKDSWSSSNISSSNYRENSKECISVVYFGLFHSSLLELFLNYVLFVIDLMFYSINTLTHSSDPMSLKNILK